MEKKTKRTKAISKKPSIDDIKVKFSYYHEGMTALEFHNEKSKHGKMLLPWRDAWEFLQAGVPVKRVTWLGYWMLSNGELVMHGKEGMQVTLDCCDQMFTLENISCDDWIPVTQKMKDELDAIHKSRILAKMA